MLVLERSVGFELLMLELEALCAIPYTPLFFLFMCILELPHILSIYFYRIHCFHIVLLGYESLMVDYQSRAPFSIPDTQCQCFWNFLSSSATPTERLMILKNFIFTWEFLGLRFVVFILVF
jgi:hypothetical protein